MFYEKSIKLKNNCTLILRSGTSQDAEGVLDVFEKTHQETDFLFDCPQI